MPDEISLPQRDGADAKAWFYLDHRVDIETWAAQREDAAEIVEQYLRALEAPLVALADEVGADLDMDGVDGEVYQVMGLRRACWAHNGINDVGVVIEWERGTLLHPEGRNEWPFTAVRLSGNRDDKERWRQLLTALAPVRKRLQGQYSNPWLYWRFETPAANATSVDPDALAHALLTSFRRLWDEAAPILDAAHS